MSRLCMSAGGPYAAFSSMIVGSSSPTPVRFTRFETGYSRNALSAAGLSASAPSVPLSHASKSSARSSTGIRS